MDRRLLRAACRLRTAYGGIRSDPYELDLPEQAWEEVDAVFRSWKKACDRNWKAAAMQQRETLMRELEHLGSQLRNRLVTFQTAARRETPPLRVLYEELAAVAAEFEEVELAEAELSITTDSVTLADVPLGPFQIRLHLDRLGNDMPYSITALEPNPAASCSETTHPHVSGERLCPGEGRSAINAALADGRLFDFFTIVDRILHTYAVGSAYVELDRWYGVSCHDCDSTMNEEDACACTHCEERVCGDCLVSCGGCGDGYCSGCIERCSRCEEYSCSGCLIRCDRCRRHVCEACREDELCETCREELEEEQDAEESDDSSVEQPAASTKPTV
jgi:hypothetical protein